MSQRCMNAISRKKERERERPSEWRRRERVDSPFPFPILISPFLASFLPSSLSDVVAGLSGEKTDAKGVKLSRKVPQCYVWCYRGREASPCSFALSGDISAFLSFSLSFLPSLSHS